jgi:hypothetical protein
VPALDGDGAAELAAAATDVEDDDADVDAGGAADDDDGDVDADDDGSVFVIDHCRGRSSQPTIIAHVTTAAIAIHFRSIGADASRDEQKNEGRARARPS